MKAATMERVLAYHRGEADLGNRALDRLLGIRSASVERRLSLLDLLARSGPASYEYQATDYRTIRDLIRWCRPGPRDVLYDLGAGYGRVILYGAAVTRARFRGIELVAERVVAAEERRVSLGLGNAEFCAGDARVADFDDGTVFFLFNPFFRSTLTRVGERLRRLAARRPLRIAGLSVSNDYFASRSWLEEITPEDQPARRFGLRLFASRNRER